MLDCGWWVILKLDLVWRKIFVGFVDLFQNEVVCFDEIFQFFEKFQVKFAIWRKFSITRTMYFTTSIAMSIDRREIPLDYQQHTNEKEKVLPYHLRRSVTIQCIGNVNTVGRRGLLRQSRISIKILIWFKIPSLKQSTSGFWILKAVFNFVGS